MTHPRPILELSCVTTGLSFVLLATLFVISTHTSGLSVQSNNHDANNFQKSVFNFEEIDGALNSFNSRHKREVTGETNSNSSKIQSIKNNLNDSHNQLLVYWAGKNTIVCLAKNISSNATSSLYISEDYGSSFSDKSAQLVIKDGSKEIFPSLDNFFSHPKNNGHFLFTDIWNKFIFTTKDYGATFTQTKLEFVPDEILYDPNSDKNILAYEQSSLLKQLWVSNDAGQIWTQVQSHVNSVSWDKSGTSPTKLYISREEPGGNVSILSSTSMFLEPNDTKVVISGVAEFEMRDNFMFATKTIGPNSLALLISYNEGKFTQAVFPSNLPITHFHIGDVSEGQLLVCAVHNESYANLYVGNQPLEHSEPVKFSLSLERVVFFKPNVTWLSSWLNDLTDEPFLELHRVDGLRGVYIANQLTTSTVSMPKFSLDHVKSVITFDQGGKWQQLNTPDVDNDGE